MFVAPANGCWLRDRRRPCWYWIWLDRVDVHLGSGCVAVCARV